MKIAKSACLRPKTSEADSDERAFSDPRGGLVLGRFADRWRGVGPVSCEPLPDSEESHFGPLVLTLPSLPEALAFALKTELFVVQASRLLGERRRQAGRLHHN